MSGKSKRSRLLYDKEALQKAIVDVRAGMPVNTASKIYEIPRTTLYNKITSKYADKKPGPQPILTATEENALEQWVVNSSEQGLMVGKQQLTNSAAILVKTLNRDNPFSNGRPGRHWYQNFLRRHKDIISRVNDNTALAKVSVMETDVRNWFCKLKLYLKRKKLLTLPASRIFTVETCELTNISISQVDKQSFYIKMAGSADGCLVPPMLLFNYQTIPTQIYETLPQGWACSKTSNGCMTPENFYEYVKEHFYPWVIERKLEFPIVLYIDGKAPYLTLSLSDFCLETKIELIGLLPNSSHILQPFNITVYSSLKKAWKTVLTEIYSQNQVSKESVVPLLISVLIGIDYDKLLINGFAKSGLYPLTENAVNYKKIPHKFEKISENENTEFITYLPSEICEEKEEQGLNVETCVYALNHLEQWLGPDKIEIFNDALECEKWTGSVEDKSLFSYWKKIKTEVGNFNFDSANSDASFETVIIETEIHSPSNESNTDGNEITQENFVEEYSIEIEE